LEYDKPITSLEHAKWCLVEAERRYGGKVVFNEDGYPLIEGPTGVCHTDAVLRAVGADWSEQLRKSD
jgi:hypothetical protein